MTSSLLAQTRKLAYHFNVKYLSYLAAYLVSAFVLVAAEVKVAALHPLLGDMARKIGGEQVEVVDLLKPAGNLHAFEPTTREMAAASGARLVLASGKQLEPYLGRLKDSLPATTRILDLGASVPDVPVQDGEAHAEHEHEHDGDCCNHGPNDPHWWHTPGNMKRAARSLAAELSKLDPEHAASYKENLKQWNREMDELNAWARSTVAAIPADNRVLVTGHAAMGHFCKEYGFRMIPIQGISREDEGNTARLASILARLREQKIPAIFTEVNASPKMLDTIARQLGVPTAPLITDGLSADRHDFPSMFRYNVETMQKLLQNKK